MTHSEIFAAAQWVTAEAEISSPIFRTEFEASRSDKGEIVICGLGFFELYINGKKVSDDLLVPAFSQYSFRDLSHIYDEPDKMSFRTWVMKYDVSSYLVDGINALAVVLGNGWYRLGDYSTESVSRTPYGDPKLCYKLDVGGKTLLSGPHLKYSDHALRYNNIYRGETYDFAFSQKGCSLAGFDDSSWKNAVVCPAPDSDYNIQTAPADKIIGTITPKLIHTYDDGSFLYDAGEGITGYTAVRSLGSGDISIWYADALNEDMTLNYAPTGREKQRDEFINSLSGQELIPHFCWHGFRYFVVKGQCEVIETRVIHSNCAVTSSFDSDNETLNWLYKTYCRTQLDNMHCGVPSDCPHIERLGYTGDGQLCSESGMLLFDSKEFYRKWMYDIADCQNTVNGHVQHTAPFCGGGGGPSAWGGAIVIVPWNYYKIFGDKDILVEFFPKMLKYFDYLRLRSEGDLVVREEKDWCLGDWCAPVEYLLPEPRTKSKVLIPEPFVNTVLFIKYMKIVKEIAALIDKADEAEHLDDLIDKCTRAVNNAYFSPFTHSYCGDVQGANSLALDAGLGDDKTLSETVEKYESRGMLDTGIVATDILPKILLERGKAQLAFDLLTSKGQVSYYYMMTHGATTLWEDWQPERSLNHPMFGAVTQRLITGFLGITQRPGSAAYKDVVIAPKLVCGMDRASGHLTTASGKIAVSYSKSNGICEFSIEIPEEVKAEFILGDTVRELVSGKNDFSVEVDQ